MSIYRVTGLKFKGYDTGETFESVLPRPLERRAIARGQIELVERSTPALVPGSYTLGRLVAEASSNFPAYG